MLELTLPFRVLDWIDKNRGELPRSVFIKKLMIHLFNEKDTLDVEKIKEL